jgi:hypothetical protein
MRQALLRGDNWWLSRQLRRDNDGRGKTHGDVPQGIAGQVARLPVKKRHRFTDATKWRPYMTLEAAWFGRNNRHAGNTTALAIH